MRKLFVAAGLLMLSMPALATKLIGLKVIDKDYLMIQFRDGEVHYRDSGTGKSALWVILSKRVMILCLSLASG